MNYFELDIRSFNQMREYQKCQEQFEERILIL